MSVVFFLRRGVYLFRALHGNQRAIRDCEKEGNVSCTSLAPSVEAPSRVMPLVRALERSSVHSCRWADFWGTLCFSEAVETAVRERDMGFVEEANAHGIGIER